MNVDADYLSQHPIDIADLKKLCTESVDTQCLNAVMGGGDYGGPVVSGAVVAQKLELKSDGEIEMVSPVELSHAQQNDVVLGPVYRAVVDGSRPKRELWNQLGRESRILMRSFEKLKVRNGVLCRETSSFKQVVLPQCFHNLVFVELHQKLGHVGVDKVFDLAQRRFYWPRMYNDIKNFIQKQCRCVANKQPNVKEKAPLHPIAAQHPFEMLSIDYIELDRCKGGYRYGLVVVDHFTRFCQFYATRKMSSQAAAEKIFNEFILHWGFPSRIHHDLGGHFNSKLFKELHRLAGIKASNTTPYYPQGDGQCERLNRTLVNMMKTLSAKEKADWKSHLPKLAYAVNSTWNKTTGYSPHYLMFGRDAVLPIDQVFRDVAGSSGEIVQSHQKFVQDWEKSMKLAYEIARKNINKSAAYNKNHYDKQATAAALQLGVHVLVQNMREKEGKPKMRSYYEENIFRVVEVREDVPVYRIQNIKKAHDCRLVHRNKLLKVDQLPLDVFEEENQTKCTTKSRKKDHSVQQIDEHRDEDSDEEFALVVEQRDVVEDVSEFQEQGLEREEADEDDSSQHNMEEIQAETVDSVAVDSGDSEEEAETMEGVDLVAGVDSVGEVESETEDDLVELSESESTDSPPVRRSTRTVIPRKMFTYTELGADPVREAVT